MGRKLTWLWFIALVITVALIILVSLRAAHADEPTSRVLEVDGKPGMWFPMATAKKMLKDITVCRGQTAELDLTVKRLDLEKSRSDLLTKNLKTTEDISNTWKTLAEDQAKRLTKANPWWKSPYLWSTVGFVLGTGVTVGVTAAVSAVK